MVMVIVVVIFVAVAIIVAFAFKEISNSIPSHILVFKPVYTEAFKPVCGSLRKCVASCISDAFIDSRGHPAY